jgi:hypothetical protein
MSWPAATRFLLADLARHTGEPGVLWNGQPVAGRFRSDPFEVPLGGIDPGLGVIQTWFYCDRRVVPGRLPELGDVLVIRGARWEIVQRDEDDLGELGFRLIKAEGVPEQAGSTWDAGSSVWDNSATAWDVDVEQAAAPRGPGRPSRRDEIVEAFETAADAGIIDPQQPLRELVPVLRQRISGDRRGLGDRTLRRTVAPLLDARRGQRRN